MDKFYFFKIILSYYNNDTAEFFITPKQDEADELGVPFSIVDLQKTPEFKEFIKRNRAGIIDAEYIEYAVAVDGKNPITMPITAEMFAEFEQNGALEIVDSNQTVVAAKSTSMGGGKMKMWCVIGAAAFAFGVLLAAYSLKGSENATSDIASDSAVSEDFSETNESATSDIGGGDLSEENSEEITEENSEEIPADIPVDTSESEEDIPASVIAESTVETSEPREPVVTSEENTSETTSKPAKKPSSSSKTDTSDTASKPAKKPSPSKGSSAASSKTEVS